MIIEMTRIRVLGPVAALRGTVRALQDAGVVQVVEAPCPPAMVRREDAPLVRRRRRHLMRALADVDAVLAGLAALHVTVDARAATPRTEAQAAWLAARLRTRVTELAARERVLADERDALLAYAPLFADLEEVFGDRAQRRISVYLLRLRGAAALDELRDALARALGTEHELRAHALASGETVVLLLVPARRAEDIERKLAAAHVERAPLPPALAGAPLEQALARMRPRLAEVIAELAALRAEAAALGRAHGGDLAGASAALHDGLVALEAEALAVTSPRVFVLEGWLPARERARVSAAVIRAVGPEVTIEEVARDEWTGSDAPVVLANPRLFAPFEVLTSLLPLPRYGSVDPTPFVAVFFPMFFGVVVGDVGYGLVLAVVALALRIAGRRRQVVRDLSRIGFAVAVYTILFGAAYGELFGDLGEHLGMRPLWFDRRAAVPAFLVLAIALGAAHLLIGLVVAAVARWRRDRRHAIGRGVTALILVLLGVALLVLVERLPAVLLMPSVIALLVAFAVVVVLEGATAVLELMSIVGHVLSYARVMALGTASVMLAVVANEMHGAFGSLALGIAFALVFHVINFVITLFSPTIHVMRLHYVEFFDTFFEPGGGPYRPLRHWSPEAAA